MVYNSPHDEGVVSHAEEESTMLDNSSMSALFDETLEKNSLTYKQSEAIWKKVRVMTEPQKEVSGG